MDAVNDMDEPMDTAERPLGSSGRGDFPKKAALDRRTMLKAAVAAGTIAGTWVAPRIETLGFAPAAAVGTPCVILNPEKQDMNQQAGQSDCATVPPCCDRSFGNAGNQPDRFEFVNPIPGCSKFVARTIDPVLCNPNLTDPDIIQFAIVAEPAEHVGTTCGDCRVTRAVLINPSGRQDVGTLNTGTTTCLGGGVTASAPCTTPESFRLAAEITCTVVTGGCNPNP
jgi:hypothetical protein